MCFCCSGFRDPFDGIFDSFFDDDFIRESFLKRIDPFHEHEVFRSVSRAEIRALFRAGSGAFFRTGSRTLFWQETAHFLRAGNGALFRVGNGALFGPVFGALFGAPLRFVGKALSLCTLQRQSQEYLGGQDWEY